VIGLRGQALRHQLDLPPRQEPGSGDVPLRVTAIAKPVLVTAPITITLVTP
jgi:hypothetical protein